MTHQTSWLESTGVCGVQQNQAGGSSVRKRGTQDLTLTLLAFLEGWKNCRIPSGLLDWDSTIHVHAIADISAAFTTGVCSMTCKLYDVVCALVTHC